MNVTRRNVDNSLVEWALYQRSKMGAVDKYNPKWKHLINGIGFCSSPPLTLNQVFEKHVVSYNVLRGTRNSIMPKKADNKALHGWWKYWRQQGKQFLQGEASKIKDQNWQKIYDLYSAEIFSDNSFEMQNGLPSRMHELSITQGVSDSFQISTTQGLPYSFQLATDNDPNNYEVKEDAVPYSIQLASGKKSSNEDMDKSDNSSYDEDESASITYLKKNPDPSPR
jgi:hypothetical protein